MAVSFFVSFVPVPKGRPRFSKFGHAYTDAKTRKAEGTLRDILERVSKVYSELPFDRPIYVNLEFHLPKPKSVKRDYPEVKPDLDNFQKLFLDCGNKILWRDDALICRMLVEKSYAADTPGITVEIGEHTSGGAED